jgi:hypothetical protein
MKFITRVTTNMHLFVSYDLGDKKFWQEKDAFEPEDVIVLDYTGDGEIPDALLLQVTDVSGDICSVQKMALVPQH